MDRVGRYCEDHVQMKNCVYRSAQVLVLIASVSFRGIEPKSGSLPGVVSMIRGGSPCQTEFFGSRPPRMNPPHLTSRHLSAQIHPQSPESRRTRPKFFIPEISASP